MATEAVTAVTATVVDVTLVKPLPSPEKAFAVTFPVIVAPPVDVISPFDVILPKVTLSEVLTFWFIK